MPRKLNVLKGIIEEEEEENEEEGGSRVCWGLPPYEHGGVNIIAPCIVSQFLPTQDSVFLSLNLK